MFNPDWAPIDLKGSEGKTLIGEIGPRAPFPVPKNLGLKWAKLSFYQDCALIGVADLDQPAPNERYVVYAKPKDTSNSRLVLQETTNVEPLVFLDWTNVPIYALNERLASEGRFLISRRMAAEYARFFFHFVRGQLGRFHIVEDVSEVPWTPEARLADRERARPLIEPVRYAGHYKNDFYQLRASIVFKNGLFHSDILIAPYAATDTDDGGLTEEFSVGQLKLTNEDLKLEDQPYIIDPPPGAFG